MDGRKHCHSTNPIPFHAALRALTARSPSKRK